MSRGETNRRSPVWGRTSTPIGAHPLTVGFKILRQAALMLVLLGGLWLALRPNTAVVEASEQPDNSAGLKVLSADAAGVELELDAASYRVEQVTASDGQLYTKLSLPGFDAMGAAGGPDLPARSVLLVVPPGARLELRTEVLAERTDRLAAPIYPAPARAVDQPEGDVASDNLRMLTATREVFAIDLRAYSSANLQPEAPAILEDAGYVRDLHVARLTVYPMQYRAAPRELRLIQRMRLHVRFIGADATVLDEVSTPVGTAYPDAGQFGDLLRQMVVNPDWVDLWRGQAPASAADTTSSVSLVASGPRYRITLRATGVYRLSYDDLAAAGLPLATLDPRQLSIYRGEEELAIEVTGETDGRFDPGDELRFYAEAVKSFYTDVNMLWLVIGTGPGRRMAERSVTPQGGAPGLSFEATQHFEQDVIYRSNMPMASDVDHWYWGQMYVLNQTAVATLTVPFTITHPLPTGTARLGLEFWGGSSDGRVTPDHHVRVYINGSIAGEVTWDDAVRASPELTFNQDLLRDGANTLALHTPGDTGARDAAGRRWESNWLNFFDLTFSRTYQVDDDVLSFTPPAGPAEYALSGWSTPDVLLFDVTDSSAPVRLVGADASGLSGDYVVRMADVTPAAGRYYAVSAGRLAAPLGLTYAPPSDLRAPAEGADYLLITHPDFLAGIEPLAEFRRSQGLRVRVVNVQDIYDAFSGGLLDPHAIRDFIRYAYFNWPGPAPSYVLLVGDGTYDFLNHGGYGAKTFIPPYLDNVDPVQGETAADNRYVTVVGDDLMPDLHLGRLPVNDPGELAAMVNKIIAYETNPAPGAWRTRAVFVADNTDAGGNFGALSDSAAAYFPPEFAVRRIYLGSADFPTNQAVRAQQATLEAFNSGPVLLNFVGHSAISYWAAEVLFGLNTLPSLTNATFPVVLPMTCLEGSYQDPRFVSLGESVVRLHGRGAIASWSPTGLGIASGHDYLHQGFYDALLNWDVRALGPATTAGKLNLYTNARASDGSPRFRDLLDTYILLGDPATRVAVPDANLSIRATGPAGPLRQGDLVTYVVTYSNTGQARVKGVVIDAMLSAALTNVAWSASDAALSLRPASRMTWDLVELAPGVTGEIIITGTVASMVPAGERSLSAEVSISSRWHETDSSDNHVGPLTAELVPADLLLRQVTEPATPVAPGELVTFTLGYVNLGAGIATGVHLSLPLPVPLDDLHVAQSGPVAAPQAGHYAWDIASVQPGEKGRMTVSGRVPHTITWEQVYWSVAAEISSNWPDADLGNNTGDVGEISISVGDAFEPDNSFSQAQRVTVPMARQPHTSDPLGDQDWVVFHAQAGVTYVVRTTNLGPEGDTFLFLWDGARNLLAKNDDAFPGSRFSLISWTPRESGDYYVMVTSAGQAIGFSYGLDILGYPWHVNLPLLTVQE